MKKLKIGRMTFIEIKKDEGIIDHARWVEFIESHKEYFTWYEDTEDGKNVKRGIDKFPDWARDGILYSLNQTEIRSTDKLVKDSFDLIISYSHKRNIRIEIEQRMTIKIAAVLFKLAEFLDAKIYIDETKEFYSIEQLN